jgi:hypothetical protein
MGNDLGDIVISPTKYYTFDRARIFHERVRSLDHAVYFDFKCSTRTVVLDTLSYWHVRTTVETVVSTLMPTLGVSTRKSEVSTTMSTHRGCVNPKFQMLILSIHRRP